MSPVGCTATNRIPAQRQKGFCASRPILIFSRQMASRWIGRKTGERLPGQAPGLNESAADDDQAVLAEVPVICSIIQRSMSLSISEVI
jgi:hypothetical protein